MFPAVIAKESAMYSKSLLPVYAIVGLVACLATLRLLRAVQQKDTEFIRKYVGDRAIGLSSKILLLRADRRS